MLAHATTAGDKRFRKAHVLDRRRHRRPEGRRHRRGRRGAAVGRRSRRGCRGNAARRGDAPSPASRQGPPRPAASTCTRRQPASSPSTRRWSTRINAVDPAITIATLAEYAAVEAGQMVATVKIIPFAVAAGLVDAGGGDPARRARSSPSTRFAPLRVGLVQTVLPGVKDSVLAKTPRVTAGAAGALGQQRSATSCARRTTPNRSPRPSQRLPPTTTW